MYQSLTKKIVTSSFFAIFGILGLFSLFITIFYLVAWATYPSPANWKLVLNPAQMVLYHGTWVDYTRLVFWFNLLPNAEIYSCITALLFSFAFASYPSRGGSLFTRIARNRIIRSRVIVTVCTVLCFLCVFLLDDVFLSWASLLNRAIQNLPILVWTKQESTTLQHEVCAFLLGTIAISSTLAFKSVLRTIQITTGSFVVLPILIFFFDPREFSINFATGLGPLSWITNEILLISLSLLFLTSTVLATLQR